MNQSHQVPHHAEEEPGSGERGREQEELVAPGHFQKGRPKVTHVEHAPPADVLDANVAAAIFGEDAPPFPQGPAPGRRPATQ